MNNALCETIFPLEIMCVCMRYSFVYVTCLCVCVCVGKCGVKYYLNIKCCPRVSGAKTSRFPGISFPANRYSASYDWIIFGTIHDW